MRKILSRQLMVLALSASVGTAAIVGCGGGSSGGSQTTNPGISGDVASVVSTYASIVYASYQDCMTKNLQLQSAIDAFVAAPSPSTLQNAKNAWLSSREVYGQTEAYRFYSGPIDNEVDGPEGLLNSWPLDEQAIDYVQSDANAG